MGLALPDMVLILGGTVAVVALIALVVGGRGGRYRGLPGWAGFCVAFGALLVLLSRGPRVVSFLFLAALMAGSLRAFFFVAPVRAKDRYAILAAYLAVPFALLPAYRNEYQLFLALVPAGLILMLPVLLSFGSSHDGLLDSAGRILLGATFFVFCTAHLGLLVHQPAGRVELFGILALLSEFPSRILGRPRPGSGTLRPTIAFAVGAAAAMVAGWLLAPSVLLEHRHGSWVGLAVAVATTAGGLVSDGIADDLQLGAKSTTVGRGSFLQRTAPVVYAAPIYFHVLSLL
jgi:predicted CDP-diglyceride synthetase/phosphatidate cytidylyltransferase